MSNDRGRAMLPIQDTDEGGRRARVCDRDIGEVVDIDAAGGLSVTLFVAGLYTAETMGPLRLNLPSGPSVNRW